MIRAAWFAALLAITAPAEAQVVSARWPYAIPTLKPAVTVTSDLVRIGDLVDNAGAVANIPIFRSPDYGTTGTVPASQVIDAVRAHDLIMIDARGLTEVEVTRAGHAIGTKDIQERVARAFAGRQNLGDAKGLVVTLDRETRPILLEPSASADLQVVRSYYDPRSGRFDITFELAGNSGNRVGPLRYTGTLLDAVEVVVLTRSVNRGDVLRNTDVAVERRPRAEVSGEVLGSLEKAIGSAARQSMRAGYAPRRADLMKPNLVRRDEAVTLVYEAPGLMLTMLGKAIDSGAEGDLVNVLNVQSKRPVQGYVSGPGRVTMRAAIIGAQARTAAAIEQSTRQTSE
jgi:flagella basal body P-ring formation protein FlgA